MGGPAVSVSGEGGQPGPLERSLPCAKAGASGFSHSPSDTPGQAGEIVCPSWGGSHGLQEPETLARLPLPWSSGLLAFALAPRSPPGVCPALCREWGGPVPSCLGSHCAEACESAPGGRGPGAQLASVLQPAWGWAGRGLPSSPGLGAGQLPSQQPPSPGVPPPGHHAYQSHPVPSTVAGAESLLRGSGQGGRGQGHPAPMQSSPQLPGALSRC